MSSQLTAKPTLIVHSQAPFNAEPPLDRLRLNMITAEPDFYVRSHGNIPQLDRANHRLRVGGRVTTKLDLSMADLAKLFPERSVTAVMQCAGNRRADMQPVKPTSGDPWAPGAIGNARWTGISLADVLQEAGADTDTSLHVSFESCDEVEMPEEGRFHYGASIPMSKATTPDVLLAYAMNGAPLTPEHGFPLRVVVPGFAGVRSPKWLATITVQDTPSDNHVQQRDYKLVPPDRNEHNVDWARGITINEMPLNAAICEPAPQARLQAGLTRVRGYAIATGRDITRVDVSSDGGGSWQQAQLDHNPDAPWSWTFWTATLNLPKGRHELAVRAWDAAGQTQPARADDTWNFKGYLSAAWHRVPVTVG